MNRTDRLHAIVVMLQSKKVVQARLIADRFGISLRTVYRDISAIEEAGIPIGAEAGTGYFLDESYRLPPIMFTEAEASALFIAAKMATQFTDNSVAEASESAMDKIKAILQNQKKEALNSLNQSVKVFGGYLPEATQPISVLTEVQKALIERKLVKFTYQAQYNQNTTQREVEPIGLVMYAMRWHLIGYCRLRKQFRDFRLDRISGFEILDETLIPTKHKGLDDYFKHQQSQSKLISIGIAVTPNVWHQINDSKFWYGFMGATNHPKGHYCQFMNHDLEGFAKWLISLGDGVFIDYPAELTNIIVEKVHVLARQYLG